MRAYRIKSTKMQVEGHGAPACGTQSHLPTSPVFCGEKPLNRSPFDLVGWLFVECISAVRDWGLPGDLMAPARMRELVLEWRLGRVFL